MTVSTNVKIARASIILIIAGVCGHALSLVREIIVANYFGITRVMDAYYAALTFPNLINGVLLSTFGAVFIPIFIRYKLKDRREANRIASVAINYLFLFLVFGSLVLFVFAPQIIKYGFHGLLSETAALSIIILRIVCFTVILSGLIGAMTGILNAHEHFAWPAYSRMFITVITILFIVFFVRRWGICTLAYGLCAGLLVQFLFLIPVTRGEGYRHYFDFTWKHPAVKEMLSLSLIFFIAIIAAQINIVVDKIMASYLATGSIAALGYADKLVQAPIIIFAGSLATAVFPFFSSQVAKNKIEELKDSLAKSIRVSGFIIIPLTVILIILAKPIIQLLFQRGAFNARATELTSAIFICYSFQLFFYTVALILGRVFLALKGMKTLMKLAIAGVIMNIIMNFAFIKIITPPAAGIALSTSGIYFIIMILELIILRKRMDYLHGKYILRGVVKIGVGSVAMGITVFLIYGLLENMSIDPFIMRRIIRVGAAGLAGAVVFMIVSFLLKLEEAIKLKRIIYRRVISIIT